MAHRSISNRAWVRVCEGSLPAPLTHSRAEGDNLLFLSKLSTVRELSRREDMVCARLPLGETVGSDGAR